MLLEQILLNLIIDVVNNDQCNPALKEKAQEIETNYYETGKIPVNEIYEQLKGKVKSLHLVGDAVSPRKLTEAIREGFAAGRYLE